MPRYLTVAAALLVGIATPAFADPFAESGDAGETLATAQVLNGNVTSISGTLIDLGVTSPIDDIDLYSFFISDPDAFSVTVTSNLSDDNDSQLFLFDSSGALIASDDDSGNGFLPIFLAGVLSGNSAGDYFLGFNLFSTDPTFTAGALSGWNRQPVPFQTGPYTLTITGANGAVPEPATWAMMLMGFGAVGFAMRRRKQAELTFRRAT